MPGEETSRLLDRTSLRTWRVSILVMARSFPGSMTDDLVQVGWLSSIARLGVENARNAQNAYLASLWGA